MTTIKQIGEPLLLIPIRHACGHYELRKTRWAAFMPTAADKAQAAEDKARGFIHAGSPCTTCDSQGRGKNERFLSLEHAQAVAAARNGGVK